MNALRKRLVPHTFDFTEEYGTRPMRAMVFRMPGSAQNYAQLLGAVTPEGFRVESSFVHPAFKRLGLGRKLYAEAAKAGPVLSDAALSQKAVNVYERFAAKPNAFDVTRSPIAQKPASDGQTFTTDGSPVYTMKFKKLAYEMGAQAALTKFASDVFEAWKTGKKKSPEKVPVREVGWKETKLS